MKIHRLGTYATGFKYYKNKIEITNNDEIEKIKLLKIPPAYDNVTIINNPKIIAFGYDSKNRKQVLYNPKFIAKQNAKKYDKISASIKFFSKLKKKIATDLGGSSGSGDEKTLAIAVILTLIFTCGFRIGNKKYEKENNSVGLTTLKYKHLKFEKNNKILIDFIGKKGVRNIATCDNLKIYDYLNTKFKNVATAATTAATATAKMEDYIFSYGAENSKVITSSDVNEYLRTISKRYSKDIIITTKDLRTWNANMLFLTFFKKLRKARRGEENRDTEKIVNKDVKRAIEMVAEKLHNSYSICKKSYIDPKIIENAIKEIK
jgi:DNA topoisomerase-1